MSESRKIPPTPKLGSISLPDNDTKIFGGTRRRLSSLLGKASVKTSNVAAIPRSMTPAPVPVSRYPYPGRDRASSLTNKHASESIAQSASYRTYPVFQSISRHPSPSPVRGGSSKVRHYPADYMSQSTTWAPSAPAHPAPGKHEGPNTPKYMKAKIKEVALKDESIVLSWPLVSYAERRNLKYPLLYFDVAFDPREPINVKDNRAMHFLPLPPEDRELPVSTHCKVTEIIIDCPHVGSLIVERPEGLRCIDVFYAIYCKYQKKPRPHEMPADRAKYQPAFEQRCKDSPGISDVNLKKTGFLRVDLLKGKRIFDGLKRSNGRWVLVINS